MAVSRFLGVAAVQAAPVPFDPEGSVRKLEAETRRVAALMSGLDLVVFPELFVTGFVAGHDAPANHLADVAEPIPGPLTERLCRLAVETGVWLVPGSLAERSPAGIHNTAIAISPSGVVCASYRKLAPWRPYERTVPGDEYVVFDIPGRARVGLMICYDGWFPEIPRTLAWMGAEVLVQPTLTQTPDREQELVLARANAITNQAFVVNPNVGAMPGPGKSIVTDPEGRVLARAGGGEEFLTVLLDIDHVRAVREHGTLGLNALWKQLRDIPPPFPPARIPYADGEVMRGLGPLGGLASPPRRPSRAEPVTPHPPTEGVAR